MVTELSTKLDVDYELTDSQIERFREHGHIMLPEVACSNSIENYRPVISKAVQDRREQAFGGVYDKPVEERDTYFKAFVQIENVWETHESVRDFVLARRFGKLAADLLGADRVRIFHDQALFKEAGGGYTPWHQDQYYWPFDTDQTVTMWMPLIDCGLESGTLVFADGSHRWGAQAAIPISDDSENHFMRACREKNARLTANEMLAGDATFHYGWTLHKAAANSRDFVREAITVIYVADGARIIEPKREEHRGAILQFLGGLAPGELVDSKQNPVV